MDDLLRMLAEHRARKARGLGIIVGVCTAAVIGPLIIGLAKGQLEHAAWFAGFFSVALVPALFGRRRRLGEIDRFTDAVRARGAQVARAYAVDQRMRVNGLPTNRFTHLVIELEPREVHLLWHAGWHADDLLRALHRALPHVTIGVTPAWQPVALPVARTR